MKRYGIRVRLPSGDTMGGAHLLGEGWEGMRWYDSATERDRAYEQMQDQPPWYRRGDSPTQILSKVEEEQG